MKTNKHLYNCAKIKHATAPSTKGTNAGNNDSHSCCTITTKHEFLNSCTVSKEHNAIRMSWEETLLQQIQASATWYWQGQRCLSSPRTLVVICRHDSAALHLWHRGHMLSMNWPELKSAMPWYSLGVYQMLVWYRPMAHDAWQANSPEVVWQLCQARICPIYSTQTKTRKYEPLFEWTCSNQTRSPSKSIRWEQMYFRQCLL